MKTGLLVAVTLVAAATALPAVAAQYQAGVPLASRINVQARDCGRQSSWRKPIITWGADE